MTTATQAQAQTIARTKVVVTATNTEATLLGDWSADNVRTGYPDLNLGNTDVSETIDGVEKTLTFTPKIGGKGADVTRTKVVVTATNTEATLLGDWSADNVRTGYPDLNLGNTDVSETIDGVEKTLTFTPKIGGKGVCA